MGVPAQALALFAAGLAEDLGKLAFHLRQAGVSVAVQPGALVPQLGVHSVPHTGRESGVFVRLLRASQTAADFGERVVGRAGVDGGVDQLGIQAGDLHDAVAAGEEVAVVILLLQPVHALFQITASLEQRQNLLAALVDS